MFNLIVLILVTIVFLMFGYLITHVDIFSPFCVFCEMFLIAEFLCLFFSRMYKVEIHLNTIFSKFVVKELIFDLELLVLFFT